MKINPVEILRRRIAQSSQRQVAKELGCTSPYISDVMAGRRGLGDKTLAAMGLERYTVTHYKRIKPMPKSASYQQDKHTPSAP